MYHLYILYSVSINRYYIGVATDVDERLRRHLGSSQKKMGIMDQVKKNIFFS